MEKLINLHEKLTFNKDVATIREFLMHCDYNENHADKIPLDSSVAFKACDKIDTLLRQCNSIIGDFIPPIKTNEGEVIYSVKTPKKPPFIVRTSDSAVIERIYDLLIRIGGWENAKFLLENLKLNKEGGAENGDF